MIKFMGYDGRMEVKDEDLVILIKLYRDKIKYTILDLHMHRLLAALISNTEQGVLNSKYIHTLRLSHSLGVLDIDYEDIGYNVEVHGYEYKLIAFHLLGYLFNGMDTKFNIILVNAGDVIMGRRELYIDVPGTYTRLIIDAFLINQGMYPERFTGYKCEKLKERVPLDAAISEAMNKYKLKSALTSTNNTFIWYIDGYYTFGIRAHRDSERALCNMKLHSLKSDSIRVIESSEIGNFDNEDYGRATVELDKVTHLSRVSFKRAEININELSSMYQVSLVDSSLNIGRSGNLSLVKSKNSVLNIECINTVFNMTSCSDITLHIRKPMCECIVKKILNSGYSFLLCSNIKIIFDFEDEQFFEMVGAYYKEAPNKEIFKIYSGDKMIGN